MGIRRSRFEPSAAASLRAAVDRIVRRANRTGRGPAAVRRLLSEATDTPVAPDASEVRDEGAEGSRIDRVVAGLLRRLMGARSSADPPAETLAGPRPPTRAERRP